ncbi:MAG TPA: Hsp33 family molecular chaperone HslO [Bacillota bacterium]|nr:Hsp33 family molecular chaperone HslO [Bacillota bacterium]
MLKRSYTTNKFVYPFVNNTKLIIDIIYQYNKTKVRKMILGKAISAVSLITGDQKISFQITMNNPKYKILLDADANGNVWGFLNDDLLNVSLKNDVTVEGLIGYEGNIQVIKGTSMNQFTRIADMSCRNNMDDISYYFILHELTKMFLKVNVILANEDFLQFRNAAYAQLLSGVALPLLDEKRQILKTNAVFDNHIPNPFC